MNPFDLSTYDFDLDPKFIATEPAHPRDQSKLLVLSDEGTTHKVFSDLSEMLTSNDVLIVNDTQVIKSRILGNRESTDGKAGGAVECFLLERLAGKGEHVWYALFKASAKAKPGLRFFAEAREGSKAILKGELLSETLSEQGGAVCVKFDRDPEPYGEIPLPPYIERKAGLKDEFDYQTRFADPLKKETWGSSAAPTAGLHFSDKLISTLEKAGVKILKVTLSVGIGTFRPVKSQDIREHKMHVERTYVSPETAHALTEARKEGKRLIAVGTTSLRVLESRFESGQFHGKFKGGEGKTDLFIYPEGPHQIQSVEGLITNFHLPKSSLFMLVCAAIGIEKAHAVYRDAKAKGYRFFSYGDALFLSPLLCKGSSKACSNSKRSS